MIKPNLNFCLLLSQIQCDPVVLVDYWCWVCLILFTNQPLKVFFLPNLCLLKIQTHLSTKLVTLSAENTSLKQNDPKDVLIVRPMSLYLGRFLPNPCFVLFIFLNHQLSFTFRGFFLWIPVVFRLELCYTLSGQDLVRHKRDYVLGHTLLYLNFIRSLRFGGVFANHLQYLQSVICHLLCKVCNLNFLMLFPRDHGLLYVTSFVRLLKYKVVFQ